MSVISYVPAQNKYSNITAQLSDSYTTTSQVIQNNYDFIDPVITQGVRKAKNFTLSISASCYKVTVDEEVPQLTYSQMMYALVYVPNGFDPLSLEIKQNETIELYKANKYIILQGLLENGKIKKSYSYLARNLAAGDKICLLIRPISDTTEMTLKFQAVLNYAIKYN
ncbi:hypothetical protein [uncultured Brachyspira sp.]|uniref:hypothetical protein n=1 Tax=uncultured Brachyspira sp. TaxID=221953 RepID=UPI0025D9C2C7|nr:hypothetical protein [uncultured Brachyspira sp.]